MNVSSYSVADAPFLRIIISSSQHTFFDYNELDHPSTEFAVVGECDGRPDVLRGTLDTRWRRPYCRRRAG